MKLGIREIYEAARQAGFTPDQATTWTAIALAESGGETGARNPSGEDSRGLWQINVDPHVRTNKWGNLYDPLVNARAAYETSHQGTDMRPWTTTHASHAGTAADYRTYLPEVSAATGYAGDGRGVEGYRSPLPEPLPPSGPLDSVPPAGATTMTSYDAIDPGMAPGSDLDTDQDGLTDAFEIRVGSRIDVADSDQDSLSDAYEVAVSHSSTVLGDSDADTLGDADELMLGTSPTAFDSDRDGPSDALEIQAGADPLRADRKVDPPGMVVPAAEPVGSTLPTADVSAAGQDFRGQDPWERVTVDGETVDKFTAAALQVAGADGGTGWHILQGSFSDDVAASGSTHSGGGVVDIAPTDGDWEGAVTALRKVGFAAWIRNVPGHGQAGSGEHIHAVLIGDEQMSDQAAVQVQSYLHNDNGLAGSAPDDGPRQFVDNRFSWADMSGVPGGGPGVGGTVDATATLASYDQIDSGVAPAMVGDSDRDGLADVFERSYRLDPQDADSDDDSRMDGLELTQGTNPRVADRPGAVSAEALQGLARGGDEDADGLSNLYEVKYGLDPRLADTDQDGLDDAAELVSGTNPLRMDSDADGLTDRIELELGTDPLEPEPSGAAAGLDAADSDLL